MSYAALGRPGNSSDSCWSKHPSILALQEGRQLNDAGLWSLSFPDYLSCYSVLKQCADEEPESPLLYRTVSEAALVRKRMRAPEMYRKDRMGTLAKHRASINGHVYDHEVSCSSVPEEECPLH